MSQLLYSTAEAAEMFGLSPKTLERKRVEGTGPKFVKLGKTVRYKESDLLEWVNANIYSSTSEFKMEAACHE